MESNIPALSVHIEIKEKKSNTKKELFDTNRTKIKYITYIFLNNFLIFQNGRYKRHKKNLDYIEQEKA